MAYPANIAPQTPSAKYDIVEVYAGATIPNIYVEEIGGTYAIIKGAKSRCRIDLPLYDQSTTRDEINASFLGRGPMSVIENPNAAGNLFTTINGDLLASLQAGETINVFPDQIATMMQQSDSFTHVAPHQNVLGQTMIRWYDTAGATGIVVGECDAARYKTSGGEPPKSIV